MAEESLRKRSIVYAALFAAVLCFGVLTAGYVGELDSERKRYPACEGSVALQAEADLCPYGSQASLPDVASHAGGDVMSDAGGGAGYDAGDASAPHSDVNQSGPSAEPYQGLYLFIGLVGFFLLLWGLFAVADAVGKGRGGY